MKLENYQTRAVEDLLAWQSVAKKGEEANLKAITGAGKTVILASYIDRLFQSSKQPTAVIWMSIGKGDLHKQSHGSLRNFLPNSVPIYTSDDFQTEDYLKENSVLVLNWESVYQTETVDGVEIFKNRIMKDGEQLNLREYLNHSREQGIHIQLVIDEAHIGMGSLSAKEKTKTARIKEGIAADRIINVSATPKKNVSKLIDVDTAEVKASGRIKKRILINDHVGSDDDEDTLFIQKMIRSGIEKQEELEAAYKAIGEESINPLCLIQIPNSKAGKIYREIVEEELLKAGYGYEEGTVASAMDDKENYDSVKENGSPVRFLLFKQAISTGWDCPRTQIWVKLRDIKSVTFDIQTLGRILRMPESSFKVNDINHESYRFFSNESLNAGYIFTDSHYEIKADEYKEIYPTVQVLKAEFKPLVEAVPLKKAVLRKSEGKLSDRLLRDAFRELFTHDGFNYNPDILREYEVGEIATEDLKNKNKEGSTATYLARRLDIEREVDSLVAKWGRGIASEGSVQRTLFAVLNEDEQLKSSFDKIRRFILQNEQRIDETMVKVRKEHRRNLLAQSEVLWEDYRFSEQRDVNEKVIHEAFSKAAYSLQPAKEKPATERHFEDIIDKQEDVLCWVKNIDAGAKGFSLPYLDPKEEKYRLFYPDYFILFTDGTFGLYETKSENDPKPEETAAKAAVLATFLEDYSNGHGGIVHMRANGVPVYGEYPNR